MNSRKLLQPIDRYYYLPFRWSKLRLREMAELGNLTEQSCSGVSSLNYFTVSSTCKGGNVKGLLQAEDLSGIVKEVSALMLLCKSDLNLILLWKC